MSELRIGVVGAGIMGTDHARITHNLISGARVVAVTDIHSARATALARELAGVRAMTSAAVEQ